MKEGLTRWGMFSIIVVIAGVGVYFFRSPFSALGQQSRKFVGQVVSFSDKDIQLQGFHILDNGGSIPDSKEPAERATAQIYSDTRFVNIIWRMPTKTSLDKVVKNKDQKEQRVVSFDDFKKANPAMVNVLTDGDTAHDQTFRAMEVDFDAIVYASQ